MSIRMDPTNQRRDSSFGNAYGLGTSFYLLIGPFHHVRGSDPLPVFFGKCCITHEPREEPLDGVGCFPVSPGIQVIGEILEFLLVTVCFAQTFNHLFLVFLGDILQNRPGAMDLAHLLGCAEEGGLCRLLDACVTIGDDQVDPGESPFFEVLQESRLELLILTIRDSCAQDLLVVIFPHSGNHENRLGDVPCSLAHLVSRDIHEEVQNSLFNRPQTLR
jgi:hypothetical protein